VNTVNHLEDMEIVPRERFMRTKEPYKPCGSRRLEALRRKHLRVAYYSCYDAPDPLSVTSLALLKAPMEAFLNSTPAWTPMGVFIDQCGRDSDWASRPVLREMMNSGAFDLIICKSLSHLHSRVAEALRLIAYLEKIGIPIYFEAENTYTGNRSDILNLTVGANLELLQEKAEEGRKRMNQRLADHEDHSNEQEAIV